MAFAPLIISAIGIGISAYGQWKAGSAEADAGAARQRAADKQAEILDFNAQVADVQAQDAVERGAQDESRFRSGVKLMIGEQRAGQAAGNIDVGFGSAVDVQADAAYLGELDAMTVRQNAQRDAWGYKVQAVDYRKRAAVTRMEGANFADAGQNAKTAARIGAVGSSVIAGGSLLAQRYGMKDQD